jgi:outer membrane protein OmpA-like peptidoglycan-associated protein
MKYLSILLAAGTVALVGPGAAGANGVQSERANALGELKFQFDSAALQTEAPEVLDQVAAFASENPDAKLVLEAYTDAIGPADYNVKLAIRRAETVRTQLKAAGIADDRIVFAIYGEGGDRRASYADDRRVMIRPTHQPLAAIIDHTFANNGTAVTWQRPLTVAQIAGTDEVASR